MGCVKNPCRRFNQTPSGRIRKNLISSMIYFISPWLSFEVEVCFDQFNLSEHGRRQQEQTFSHDQDNITNDV